MLKDKRRFITVMAALVALTVVEILTNEGAIGISGNYMMAVGATLGTYFGTVAVDKHKNGIS